MSTKRGYEKITLTTTPLQLLIVHGALRLGFSHPMTGGRLHKLGIDFVHLVEDRLVDAGLFSQEDVDALRARTDALALVGDNGRRACKVCGCTDDHACEGGCFWVAEDLCSACALNIGGNGKGATP